MENKRDSLDKRTIANDTERRNYLNRERRENIYGEATNNINPITGEFYWHESKGYSINIKDTALPDKYFPLERTNEPTEPSHEFMHAGPVEHPLGFIFQEENEGDKKRKEVYTEEISEGYRFLTNVGLEELEEAVEEYKSEGLEVIVEDSAFGSDGVKYNSMKAILIRGTRKRHDTNLKKYKGNTN
ncbi:MAG: hypothetical protein WDZ69_00525 [Candidatus Pacearchaeota archaeon]